MMSYHPVRGILLIISAVFLFACLDTTIRYLSAHFPVPVMAFVRYAVHLGLMLMLLLPREGLALVKTHRPVWVIARGMCLVGLTFFMMFGLSRLPVAEATAISFVAPLLVVLLAKPLLGERIGLFRWLAVLTGFAGVLLVARPGGSLDPFGVFMVLCAALCGTAYQLLSRVLAGSVATNTLLFYAALAGCVCFGLSLPWVPATPSPSFKEVALLFSLGLTGGLGHYLFTRAYRHAPASMLAPFTYLQLLWAGLLGWGIFGRVPDPISLLGMGVIALAGISVAVQQGRARKAQ